MEEKNEEKTLIEIKDKVVPCTLVHNFKYYSRKRTCDNVKVYTNLVTKKFKSGVYLITKSKEIWPQRNDNGVSTFKFLASLRAIVHLHFSTRGGEINHFEQFFRVKEGERGEIKLEQHFVKYENLEPLESPSEDTILNLKAQLLNSGTVEKFSNYDPVVHLYYFFNRQSNETSAEVEGSAEASEEEAFAGWDTEIKQESTAVQPTDDFEKIALKQGLKRVKLVVFDLPTEYKDSKTTYRRNGNSIEEVKTITADPATFRTLRKQFYTKLHSCAYKTKAGWILLSKADPTVLDPIIKQLNELARTKRAVELIEAYFPRETIRTWLSEYIVEIRANKQKIQQKISEKASEAEAVQRLEKQLSKLDEELRMLESELKLLS